MAMFEKIGALVDDRQKGNQNVSVRRIRKPLSIERLI